MSLHLPNYLSLSLSALPGHTGPGSYSVRWVSLTRNERLAACYTKMFKGITAASHEAPIDLDLDLELPP